LIAFKKLDLDFEDNTVKINKTLYNESSNMKNTVWTPQNKQG